jgi:hypothetical protein
MRKRQLFFTCTLFILGCGSLAAQTNAAFLNRIAAARFVMVTTENGDPFDPKSDASDRRAVGELQNEISKWNRFTIVYKKEDADIVLAVRTSGRIRANSGVHIGSQQDPSTGKRKTVTGPVLTADAGPKDDLLSVYSADEFPNASALWRREQKDGLSSPSYSLFTQFKRDVEKASAKKP